jgi:hypothetical protein
VPCMLLVDHDSSGASLMWETLTWKKEIWDLATGVRLFWVLFSTFVSGADAFLMTSYAELCMVEQWPLSACRAAEGVADVPVRVPCGAAHHQYVLLILSCHSESTPLSDTYCP